MVVVVMGGPSPDRGRLGSERVAVAIDGSISRADSFLLL